MNSFIDMSSKQSKLIGLFALGLVLLNFPLLSIIKHPVFIGGIPAVYIYLFCVWLIIILVMRQNLNQPAHKNNKKENK